MTRALRSCPSSSWADRRGRSTTVEATASAKPPTGIDPAAGIENLDHLIFIVQENRSFDHYFGTFPGANGIPRVPNGRSSRVIPIPSGPCRAPYHDLNLFDSGGPHGERLADLDRRRQDGRVRAFAPRRSATAAPTRDPDYYPCRRRGPGRRGQPDVMGFHTAREIPNYWTYAEATRCRTGCSRPAIPGRCRPTCTWSRVGRPHARSDDGDELPQRPEVPGELGRLRRNDLDPADGRARPYIWADITWMLDERGRRLGLLRRPRHVHRPAVRRPPAGDRAGAEPAARVHGRGQNRQARQHATTTRVLRRGGRRHAAAGLVGHAHLGPRRTPAGLTSGTARPGSPGSSTR